MYMRALTEEEAETLKCHWQKVDLGITWKTECGHEYQLPSYIPPTPNEEDFKYCPFCGSEISLE